MGAQIVDVVGDLITFKVWGTLSEPELAAAQRVASAIFQARASVSLLVQVEQDFQGWEHGEWADFSFQVQHDGKIQRMALVGDRRWEDLAVAFVGKGMRAFPVGYFQPAELGEALEWLAQR